MRTRFYVILVVSIVTIIALRIIGGIDLGIDLDSRASEASVDLGKENVLYLPQYYQELQLYRGYIYYCGVIETPVHNKIGLYRTPITAPQDVELVMETDLIIRGRDRHYMCLYKKNGFLIFEHNNGQMGSATLGGPTVYLIDENHTLVFLMNGRMPYDFDSEHIAYHSHGYLHVKELNSGEELRRVSLPSLLPPSNNYIDTLVINGNYVCFIAYAKESYADDLPSGYYIFRYDITTEVLEVVSDQALWSWSPLYLWAEKYLVIGLVGEGEVSERAVLAIGNDNTVEVIAGNVSNLWVSFDDVLFNNHVTSLKGMDIMQFYENYHEHHGLRRLDMESGHVTSLLANSETYSVGSLPIRTESYLIVPVCTEPNHALSVFPTWQPNGILVTELLTGDEYIISYPLKDGDPIWITAEGSHLAFYVNGELHLADLSARLH